VGPVPPTIVKILPRIVLNPPVRRKVAVVLILKLSPLPPTTATLLISVNLCVHWFTGADQVVDNPTVGVVVSDLASVLVHLGSVLVLVLGRLQKHENDG